MAYPFQLMENIEYNMEVQEELNFTPNSGHCGLDESDLNIQNPMHTVNLKVNQQEQEKHLMEQHRIMQQKLINQHNYLEQQKCIQNQKLIQQRVKEQKNTNKEQNAEKIINQQQDRTSGALKHNEVVNDEVDMAEEREEENCITQLRYNDADQIIKEKTKQIILAQERGKTMLSILNRQICNITEDIDSHQKLIGEQKSQEEIAKKNVEISVSGVSSLRERVNTIGDIVVKLDGMVTNLKTRFQTMKNSNAKLAQDTENQRKEIESFKKKADLRISFLKKTIDAENLSLPKSDPYENKNAMLKKKISERKEYLNKLEGQIEDLKSNVDREGKQKMLRILEEKQSALTKIKGEQEQFKLEGEKNIQRLKEKMENSIKIMKEAEKKKHDADMELKEMIESIESVLLEKQKAWEASAQEENRQREELKTKFETLSRDYATKLARKNELLLEKFEMEKKLLKNESVKAKLEFLEEQYEIAVQKESSMREKLKKLADDTTVQTLLKEKAYLESSKVYLNEKFQNLKEQLDKETAEYKKMEYDNISVTMKIKEKKIIFDDLDKQIKSLQENASSTSTKTVPSGILKATVNTKQRPFSPKTVKFVDVSSQDSSSLSVETSNSNIVVKNFDELLEEHRRSEKYQTMKKRKLDFD